MQTLGLERDAVYLVRPDGYVAFAASADARALDYYLRSRQIVARDTGLRRDGT